MYFIYKSKYTFSFDFVLHNINCQFVLLDFNIDAAGSYYKLLVLTTENKEHAKCVERKIFFKFYTAVLLSE
jgi:hypothetical protein